MTSAPTPLRLTRGLVALLALSAFGVALVSYRFAFGLGAVTNLSDGYPWGFWIGIDILVGIALAAGGFVIAGLVHLFGGRQFHPLARPAILTALIGYLLFILALAVDLGRPWNIWWALVSWNHHSPMFEVAWCVMFYTGVLLLEFTPAVLERLGLRTLRSVWYQASPLLVIGLLTLFTYAMTDDVAWTAAIAGILMLWELLMRTGVAPRDHQVPVLLIMAGVILSTLHQSSLGTLFLITDKLGPLWYTPVLPLVFLVSAVMAGPAMVIVESLLSARVLRHRPALPLLRPLGRAMPYLLGTYLVVRIGDLVLRDVVLETMRSGLASWWWWLEIGLVLTSLAMFANADFTRRRQGLLWGALIAVAAVVVHRTGVAMVGIDVPEYASYVPAWPEVVITFGIIALGILAFRVAVAVLPVYESHGPEATVHVPRPAAGPGAVASARAG